MSIKKVVASLSLVTVGLLGGGVVLAAQADQESDVSALKDRVSQMESTLATLSQTSKRDVQENPNWSQYIRLSGGLAVDTKLAGSLGDNITPIPAPTSLPAPSSSVTPTAANDATTAGRFTGENIQRVGVNDAFLNIDANVNDWTTARLGFTYTNVSNYYDSTARQFAGNGINGLSLDQAYVTMANFNEYPYYARLGVQYVDYGMYDLHPITKPFTQVFSEIDDAALQIGLIDANGLRASAFLLPIPGVKKLDSSDEAGNNTELNYGGSIAYAGELQSSAVNYTIKAGYLANIAGLDVWSRDNVPGVDINDSQLGGDYHSAVPGLAVNFVVASGPFDASVGYAGAVKSFSDGDVIYQFDENGEGKNAKPNAASLSAGYSFKFWDDRTNRIGLGYDRSWQASPFGLPEHRYSVNYSLDLFKNTSFTLQWDHDVDYDKNNVTSITSQDNGTAFATGKNFNVVTARVAVNFG